MAEENSTPEENMNNSGMPFETKKRIIEERIADVKQSMLNLRMTMRETTEASNLKPNKEVRGVFYRVMKLQSIANSVSENLKMQLEESKRMREKKLLEHKRLLDKSRRILDESKCLIAVFEEYVKQNRKRQQFPLSSSESHQNIKN
ncbi:hypothetical protein LOAG_10974 [Loa loa]|uniref:Uncharacterized protein n=1 Tax=Loa loa TaxID=7209 RepID=A0A1S0TQ19_LOALO|nr:hypothetical protein LOAG_10974 [Loa loa]EFO17526.1 hypothetical protein LOAG_10974 [Loa loa]